VNRFKQFDQLKMLANAEKEIQKIEFLNQINTMQNEKIHIQKIILIIGVVSILIILVLLFITLKDLKIKKKLNISLVERAYEIETLIEELKSTNEELHAQRDNLENALTNLQNTQQQLVQAEKMASLGVLASGVAHEINNPLNYINGGLMGLKDYYKNPKENESNIDFCIDAISEGVEKASIIVSGLNFFSRNKDLISENIDMNRIIDTCLMMLNSEISKRIEIVKNYTKEKYNLTGNEVKLHQVIMNIILNSVQAIEKKGEIIISTEVLEDNYLIAITDTGCGIKEESLSKIFDPFFTTKEPGKGTGLGLSITYNIIKEHNGTIEINSTLNKGTIVKIKLPLSAVAYNK
jgi:C4-dicarboxylate-specific signal transduction histidine kinase